MNVAQGVPCTSTRKLGFHVLSECDHSDNQIGMIGPSSARCQPEPGCVNGCVLAVSGCPGCVLAVLAVWLCPGCGCPGWLCPGCVLAVLAVSMGGDYGTVPYRSVLV